MWNAVLAMHDYEWSVEKHETTESMRRRLDVEGPTFLEHVTRVSREGRLDETFVDAQCTPADVYTHGGMIAHVLTFAAHRRTLVAGALIDAGIIDPAASARREPPARVAAESVDLSVDLGRGLILPNPSLVASGTFGYG